MGRRSTTAPKHRAVRPRYGRIGTALTSVGITTIAVLGAAGALPGGAERQPATAAPTTGDDQRPGREGGLRLSDHRTTGSARSGTDVLPAVERPGDPPSLGDLPEDSGSGRRVVFDMRTQRVWLVSGSRQVERTYLVSGSVTDNLAPGSYEVYSTSRHAVGVAGSGTMEYMVRFARGDQAAIGFHDIPVKDGELVQSRDELGRPQSHGCIRQWRPDARALWRFAKVGTTVVVTA
jgi:L,D-transpeptidase catalytic domain